MSHIKPPLNRITELGTTRECRDGCGKFLTYDHKKKYMVESGTDRVFEMAYSVPTKKGH